jgi:CRP-like cAMP-binding protein
LPGRAYTEVHALVRKLRPLVELTSDELDALRSVQVQIRSLEGNTTFVNTGEKPTLCCLILSGFAYRYRILDSGRRQIFSIHIPGDIPDLQSLFIDKMDHSIGTLNPVTVGLIHIEAIRQIITRYPRIAGLLWRETLVDAAISRAWMARIGRRNADQRIAHLLCELFIRTSQAGLSRQGSVPLPITQTELADSLGLSGVQVNRSLRQLRTAKLIELRTGTLTVLDWDGLREVALFDETYLHIRAHVA